MAAGRMILRVLKGIWGVLDVIVDLLVLAFAAILVLFLVSASVNRPQVPASAALVLNPQGDLVEQYSGDPVQRAVDRMLGRDVRPQTRMRDVLAAIREAETDPRIKAMLIDSRHMAPAALSKLQTIGDAIHEFKSTGKPVFAVLDAPGQSQYYLASMADKVFLNPHGTVAITGFGVYREYFKDAIDKLAIDWNVFRVGKYKSYVEPFTRNSMSKPAAEADKALLDVLWGSYQKNVAAARGLKPGAVASYVNDMPKNLAAVDGDSAKLAMEAGLVDKLATHDQVASAVAAVAGVGPGGDGFNQIGFRDYLVATGELNRKSASANEVAVIVAEGDILAGNQPPGTIGGESLSRLIRNARNNGNVKAVVLRVDSPGGSAFASQLILRQVQLTKAAGKPVIVSMGSVAASGGYWISMAADRIYAHPTTITGSIGILGMFPTFQDSLAKLGIHNDGIGTTKLSGDFRPTRAMSPEAKKIFQLTINHGYDRFVGMVAKTRHLSIDRVQEIAQGRVWSGKDAKRLGLIDEFGGLKDAIKAAAQLAGIANGYTVHYVEQPLSFMDRLLRGLSQQARGLAGPLIEANSWTPAKQMFSRLHDLVSQVARFNDPRGVYAYCFCALSMER
ncbi:MAG TPA: signal peptide peptidase SppA [Gammaproteobacteria bacterium]|nr:signal peptide peptidase SppA [Gammaproteobacteria bacterium]